MTARGFALRPCPVCGCHLRGRGEDRCPHCATPVVLPTGGGALALLLGLSLGTAGCHYGTVVTDATTDEVAETGSTADTGPADD